MSENKIQKAIAARLKEKKQVINLSFADYTFYESPLSLSRIRDSFVNIFKYPYYYPTARGETTARQAISLYYKKFDQNIAPEDILLTSSINQAYLYLLKLFGADNGQILVPKQHSPALDEVAFFLDQKNKYFQLDPNNHWQIDLASLRKAITPKTRAIFLSSPHLPTGAIQSAETLTALFNLLKGKNITVVIDESQSDFIFNKKEFPISESFAEAGQSIITLQTLSNGFALPGFKLAWLTFHGPAAATKQLYQSVEYLADTFLTLNQLSQTVLPEVVKYSDKWRYKFAKQVEKNYKLTTQSLKKIPQLKLHQPEGGFYALIELTTPIKKTGASRRADIVVASAGASRRAGKIESPAIEDLVIDLLKQTGVYLHPGFYYGFEGNYLVICFLQDPKVLANSLSKLRKYFKK